MPKLGGWQGLCPLPRPPYPSRASRPAHLTSSLLPALMLSLKDTSGSQLSARTRTGLCLWCGGLKAKGMSSGPHSQAVDIHGVPVPPSQMPVASPPDLSASAVGAQPGIFCLVSSVPEQKHINNECDKMEMLKVSKQARGMRVFLVFGGWAGVGRTCLGG